MPKPTQKPTAAEQTCLDLFLREMRHAVAKGEPLHVTFDPFTAGGGAYFFYGYTERGGTTEITGRMVAKRQRGAGR